MRFRLLANSNPLLGDADLLRITPSGTKFSWQLAPDNQERLRSTATFDTKAAAHVDAENALAFAARSDPVCRRRHRRRAATAERDGRIDRRRPGRCGELADVRQRPRRHGGRWRRSPPSSRRLRLESSPSPFERRVAYLTGIREPAAPAAADGDQRELPDRRRPSGRRAVRQALASVRAARECRAGAAEQPAAFQRAPPTRPRSQLARGLDPPRSCDTAWTNGTTSSRPRRATRSRIELKDPSGTVHRPSRCGAGVEGRCRAGDRGDRRSAVSQLRRRRVLSDRTSAASAAQGR